MFFCRNFLSSFLTGMSIGQVMINSYNSVSYNVVIMYAFYYMFASFTLKLPWIGCDHGFNTHFCSELPKDCFAAGGIIAANGSCVQMQGLTDDQLDMYNITYNPYSINDTETIDGYNISLYKDPLSDDRISPSEEYWR